MIKKFNGTTYVDIPIEKFTPDVPQIPKNIPGFSTGLILSTKIGLMIVVIGSFS